jgi:hypothetical protein
LDCEPSLGESPVALYRLDGDAQNLGNLVFRATSKKAQFYDPRLPFVLMGEPLKSFMNLQKSTGLLARHHERFL